MLRQPVLVFESSGAKLRTVYERAVMRELRFAVFTAELFATGHDEDNRAAVRAVPSEELDLVGLAVRAGSVSRSASWRRRRSSRWPRAAGSSTASAGARSRSRGRAGSAWRWWSWRRLRDLLGAGALLTGVGLVAIIARRLP